MSVSHESMRAKAQPRPDRHDRDEIDPSRPAVGQSFERVDGPLKVRGKARFAAEVPYPKLAYGSMVYSSIARGHITKIDSTAARTAPGVALVLTHDNAPKMSAPPLFPEGASASSLPVMQDDVIRWNGQPVALVVAETQEQADHAAKLVSVTYRTEHANVSLGANRSKAKSPENILGEPARVAKGDAEAALAGSAVSVDQTYRTPRYNHAAIELHAVTVAWEKDRLTVHDSSQAIHLTQKALATVFDLPPENVRVLSPFCGGGFGNKLLWQHHVLACAAARMIDRPLRLVISREGVFRETGGRTTTEQRVALGAQRDGKLTALIHTGVAAMTDHNNCPEQFTFPARHLYDAETFLLEQKIIELDMVPNTFMRAPGESVGTFALESALDELSYALKMDPIELRTRIEPKRDPISGLAFSQRGLLETYSRGAERFGWKDRNPEPRARREGEWLIGCGMATATYPYHRMPGGVARIRLTADGHAVVQMGSHEMGMGTATAQAQFAADRLGLPFEKVAFEYGDSALANGTVAGGSSQSATIIAAVIAASDKLFKQLIDLAGAKSPLAGLSGQEVEARQGRLASRADPGRSESYEAILTRAGKPQVECESVAPDPAEMKQRSMHSYGAQFCELRVSAISGEIRITRWVGAFDAGRIINPRTAASQFRGGIIMGIGLALTEETLFDERTGRIMNPSLSEYHVPVHLDVPEITVSWNDSPDPYSPHGVRGIGEIGITGAGAAIANAVYNATGIRVRELPITLDKLL